MRRNLLPLAIAVAATLAAGGFAAATPAAAGHNPGVTGKTLTIATKQNFGSFDVAADSSGTAYIAWIAGEPGSTGRDMHFCTLPVGSTSCQGGVQDIDPLDSSSANDVKVLSTPSGKVTVLWFHNTAGAINGPEGGAIAEVTAQRGKNLTAPQDVAVAPSFGQLFDAEYTQDGSKIWTVAYPGLPAHRVQVTPGIGTAFTTVKTPWVLGDAELAFNKNQPVMTIDKYGAISVPAKYASGSMTATFGKFHNVPGTWTGRPSALANTPNGLRFIGTNDDADYRPVIAKWNGHAFTKATFTADHNACAPAGHDVSRDSSGRLLDVANECGRITIADYADDSHAAIYRYTANHGSTIVTNRPQIASGTRGIATVVYSTQTDGVDGDGLHVIRVALPDTTEQVHKHNSAGKITLIGPTSCLPPVQVHVKVGANPAKHWTVKSRTLKLGSRTVHKRRVDGATLTPGKTYTLNGSVVFTKGSKHSTLSAALKFTTCAKS
jgi:hypothetical protein